MARPIKEGLDYFPFDVDFFNDEKLEFVSARFDEKGELIAVKLLCRIYRQGYYLHWNEDMALLFSKGAGKNISPSLANEVVNELLKRDFFNKVMFKRFSILTSHGIQKRFLKICHLAGRKTKILEKYLIYSQETPVNSEETPINSAESTQSKVKESKEKKSSKAPVAPDDANKFLLETKFSENFYATWALWKDYKLKEFKFKFKSEQSEQAALAELVTLSGRNEKNAKAIIDQSMANGWKGFFELKIDTQAAAANTNSPPVKELEVLRNHQDLKIQKEINLLYERFFSDESLVTQMSTDPLYYDYLKKCGLQSFSNEDVQNIRSEATKLASASGKSDQDTILFYMKKVGVIEIFKQLKAQAKETVFDVERKKTTAA